MRCPTLVQNCAVWQDLCNYCATKNLTVFGTFSLERRVRSTSTPSVFAVISFFLSSLRISICAFESNQQAVIRPSWPLQCTGRPSSPDRSYTKNSFSYVTVAAEDWYLG